MSASFSIGTGLTEAEMEPVRNFLNNALQAKQNGQPLQYQIVVQQFKVKDDPETLWKVVIALNSFASLLTSRPDTFKEILSAVFNYDWRGELKLTKAILDLTVNLVSTNAIYVNSALELLVQYFVPTFNALAKEIASDSSRTETLQYIHQIIQKIIQQTPTGQNLLFTILKSSFPHKRFSRVEHTEYINQLLLICEYLPSLEFRILQLIITKCLEMDVEIIIEDTGDVRIQREVEQEHYYEEEIFQLEDNEALVVTTTATATGTTDFYHGAGAANNSRIPPEVADLADKLDCMLFLLVNYIEKQMQKFASFSAAATAATNAIMTPEKSSKAAPPSSSSSSTSPSISLQEQKFYRDMLHIFETNLLSAFKSKFTQFLIFYIASHSKTFTELLIQLLLRIGLYTTTTSSIKRQSAIMYLASFLSRANFIPIERTHETLSEMIQWSAYYVYKYHAETILYLPNPLQQAIQEKITSMTTLATANTMTAISTAREKKISSQEELKEQMNTYLGYLHQTAISTGAAAFSASSSSALSVGSTMTMTTSTTHSNAMKTPDLFIDHIDYDDYGRLYVKEHTVGQHELFYAVIQSLCYTLCFYGLPLTTLQQENDALVYYWNYIFVSRFDPLRYCLKSVKNEFLQLARMIGLFDEKVWECFAPDLLYINDNDSTMTPIPIWQRVEDDDEEENEVEDEEDEEVEEEHAEEEGAGRGKSSRRHKQYLQSGVNTVHLLDNLFGITSSSGEMSIQPQGLVADDSTTEPGTLTATWNTSTTIASSQQYFRKSLGPNTLESFFPFDPCLLVKMHSCIDSKYRSWQGVPGVDDDFLYPSYGRSHAKYVRDHDSEITSTTTTSAGSSLVIPSSYLSSGGFMIQEMTEVVLEQDDEGEDSEEEDKEGHHSRGGGGMHHRQKRSSANKNKHTTSSNTNTTNNHPMLSSSLRIAETEIDNYDAMLQAETWRLRQTTTSSSSSASSNPISIDAAMTLTMKNLQQMNDQYTYATQFPSYPNINTNTTTMGNGMSSTQYLHHKSPVAMHVAMSPADQEEMQLRRRPRLYSIGSTGSW